MDDEVLPRPFAVEFVTNNVRNALDLVIEFAHAPEAAMVERIEEVMNAFAELGQAGGFGGTSLNPGLSGMTPERHGIGGTHGAWSFSEVRLDPAASFVLLNMLHYIHLEDVPIVRVRVAWAPAKTLKNPLAIQFPQQWPRLSYSLEWGEMLGEIDFVVEFTQPQPEDVTEAVVDTMSRWLLAAHRGAYADDGFDPATTAIYLGPDVMSVSNEQIIWYIDRLRSSEYALDGLLNVLEWVHQHTAPISRVEIGPL